MEAEAPCPSSFGGEEPCCPTRPSHDLSSSRQQVLGQVPFSTILKLLSPQNKVGPQSFGSLSGFSFTPDPGPSSSFCPAAQAGFYYEPWASLWGPFMMSQPAIPISAPIIPICPLCQSTSHTDLAFSLPQFPIPPGSCRCPPPLLACSHPVFSCWVLAFGGWPWGHCREWNPRHSNRSLYQVLLGCGKTSLPNREVTMESPFTPEIPQHLLC